MEAIGSLLQGYGSDEVHSTPLPDLSVLIWWQDAEDSDDSDSKTPGTSTTAEAENVDDSDDEDGGVTFGWETAPGYRNSRQHDDTEVAYRLEHVFSA